VSTKKIRIAYRLAALAGLVFFMGCSDQSAAHPDPREVSGPHVPVDYRAIALAQTMAINHYWVLVTPAVRSYAADRTPFLGGPWATNGAESTPGMGGGLGQINDANWIKSGYFPSESECETRRSKNLIEVRDPKWIAQEAAALRAESGSRNLMLDSNLEYELMLQSKCVSAAKLLQN
jgi:hypothetical protein